LADWELTLPLLHGLQLSLRAREFAVLLMQLRTEQLLLLLLLQHSFAVLLLQLLQLLIVVRLLLLALLREFGHKSFQLGNQLLLILRGSRFFLGLRLGRLRLMQHLKLQLLPVLSLEHQLSNLNRLVIVQAGLTRVFLLCLLQLRSQ